MLYGGGLGWSKSTARYLLQMAVVSLRARDACCDQFVFSFLSNHPKKRVPLFGVYFDQFHHPWARQQVHNLLKVCLGGVL